MREANRQRVAFFLTLAVGLPAAAPAQPAPGGTRVAVLAPPGTYQI